MDRVLRALGFLALFFCIAEFLLLQSIPSVQTEYTMVQSVLQSALAQTAFCLCLAAGVAALVVAGQRRTWLWFAVLAVVTLVAVYGRYILDLDAVSYALYQSQVQAASGAFLDVNEIIIYVLVPLPTSLAVLLYGFTCPLRHRTMDADLQVERLSAANSVGVAHERES